MESTSDEFGRILVEGCFDETIATWRAILSGQINSVRARRVRRQFDQLDPSSQQFVFDVVPKIVESTLFQLLVTIQDEPRLAIAFRPTDHNLIDMRTVCEYPPGDLDGWLRKYSRQVASD
jgi:hypothetical protein